jgi:hypothetical protein
MVDWMMFLEDLAIKCELSPGQKSAFLARFDRANAGKNIKWIIDRTKDDDDQQVFAGEAAFTKLMTAVYRAFQQQLFPDLSKVPKGKKEKLEAFLKSEFERRRKAEIPVAESMTEPWSGLNPGVPMPKVRLPENFVARPEALAAVKRKLLVESEQTLVVNAITGLGGLGKSVLATVIVLDPEVQTRFEDGILWKTLGQSPDLLSCLGDWIRELDKSREIYSANTVEAASRYLGTLLAERRMLLVVDDVWNGAHAEWFRVGGPDCRLLVTTREKWRLDGVAYHELDLMSEEESLELVRRKLNNKWKPEMKVEVAAFARLVGYLPLALDLAANLVPEGLSWEELRSEFEVERRAVALDILDSSESFEQLSEEEREKEERKHSLQACFNLSLKRLKPEQLKQFTSLGVLPEDVNLTARVAAVLWDLTEIKAKKVLIDLRNRSFLTDGVMTVKEKRTYRVHDLIHDMARGLIEQGTLEFPILNSECSILNSAHGKFLGRYRKCCSNGRWDGLPNDGYIHRLLTWHMEKAGWVDEIHALMVMSDERGRNAWFEACEQLGQPEIFVQDIERGWRLAEEIYEQDSEKAIVLQVRYALTLTTVKSRLNNISPVLLAALVKHGNWSVERAWAFVESIHHDSIQARALAALIPYLSDPLLAKALQIVDGMTNRSDQAECFVSLAKLNPEFVPKAYNAIQDIQGVQAFYNRATLLSRLSEDHQDFFDNALEQAEKIPYKYLKACILVGLLPRKNKLLKKILQLTEDLTQGDYDSLSPLYKRVRRREQAFLYSKLVKYKPILLNKVLKISRQLQKSERASILIQLAQHDESLLDETLESIQNLQRGFSKSEFLTDLIKHDSTFLTDALTAAQQIEDEAGQALLLIALIEYNSELLDDAIEKSRQVQNNYQRAFLLSKIANKSSEIFNEALIVSRESEEEHLQASVLIDLSKISKSDIQKDELLEEALNVAINCQQDFFTTGTILKDLSTQILSKDLFDRMMILASSIQDPVDKAVTLAYLSKHDSSITKKVLELVDFIENQDQLINDENRLCPIQYEIFLIMLILAEQQNQPFLEAESFLQKIEDPLHYALALYKLVKIEPSFCGRALEATNQIHDLLSRTCALESLFWDCPESFLPKIMDAIDSITSPYYKASTYSVTILESLPNEGVSFLDWKALLHLLAHRKRNELLKDLVNLIPTIQCLGSKSALNGVVDAMRGVCGQWK